MVFASLDTLGLADCLKLLFSQTFDFTFTSFTQGNMHVPFFFPVFSKDILAF